MDISICCVLLFLLTHTKSTIEVCSDITRDNHFNDVDLEDATEDTRKRIEQIYERFTK